MHVLKTILFNIVQVGWSVGFYGISTIVGYLTPNPFLYKYSKQFSLASVHSLIIKNISISNYSVYSNRYI